MVISSESAPRERESKSSSCRIPRQFRRVWEPCRSGWVIPRSSWVAYSKCYVWYNTTHLSSPPVLGTRRQRTRRSLVGRSTNMKAIPWFAQHTCTSGVDSRWSVVTVLEEWASAPWTGCRADCARFEWVPLVANQRSTDRSSAML